MGDAKLKHSISRTKKEIQEAGGDQEQHREEQKDESHSDNPIPSQRLDHQETKEESSKSGSTRARIRERQSSSQQHPASSCPKHALPRGNSMFGMPRRRRRFNICCTLVSIGWALVGFMQFTLDTRALFVFLPRPLDEMKPSQSISVSSSSSSFPTSTEFFHRRNFMDAHQFRELQRQSQPEEIELVEEFCSTCIYNPMGGRVTCDSRAESLYRRYRYKDHGGTLMDAQRDVMTAEPIHCVFRRNNSSVDLRRDQLKSLGLEDDDNNGDDFWFLKGTTILRDHDGAITLSNVNVCVVQSEHQPSVQGVSYNPRGDTRPIRFGSTPAPGTESFLSNTYHVDWIAWRDLIFVQQQSIVDTQTPAADLVHAPRIEEPALFVPDWKEANNPGHCLNDLTFGIAMDVWKVALGGETNRTTTITAVPYYPRFVHANSERIHNETTRTVCTDMLETRYGLIDSGRQEVVQHLPPTTRKHDGKSNITSTLCFASLTIPKLTALRQTRTLEMDAALRHLRARSFDVLKRGTSSSLASITEEPWPPIVVQHNHSSRNDNHEETYGNKGISVPTIFLYDRTDSSARRLANAIDIKMRLESAYFVRVDLWNGTAWSRLNHTAQATLYNQQRYILAPHGAQFINLLHTRPGTKVVEVQCMVPNRRWATQQQWFSAWSHVIDVDLYVWMETDGCRTDGSLSMIYRPPFIRVANVTALVEETARHFGLRGGEFRSSE